MSGDRQGGSTITQQLARNLYPEEIGRALTINRKVKEAITALKIESVYTKDEILETYLNTVPFLYNAFGIEMAARTYFDKSADKLDVLESATLIGMLKGTSYYNPVLNPERALGRRNLVLAQMAKHGKLDPAKVAGAGSAAAAARFRAAGRAAGTGAARRAASAQMADRVGRPQRLRHLRRRAGGAHHHQTPSCRKPPTRPWRARWRNCRSWRTRRHKAGEERPVLQAGFLALDPRSGHVRAWVGSRDFAQEQFDHVSQARRQPGSTFKPFVYGAAFEQGFAPSYTLDRPARVHPDGRRSLVAHRRHAAHRAADEPARRTGLFQEHDHRAADAAGRAGARSPSWRSAMGVRQSKLDPVPSLALGTSPVTLREMVAAYGTIANGGNYIEPVLVTRIEDRNGQLLQEWRAGRARAGLASASMR